MCQRTCRNAAGTGKTPSGPMTWWSPVLGVVNGWYCRRVDSRSCTNREVVFGAGAADRGIVGVAVKKNLISPSPHHPVLLTPQAR